MRPRLILPILNVSVASALDWYGIFHAPNWAGERIFSDPATGPTLPPVDIAYALYAPAEVIQRGILHLVRRSGLGNQLSFVVAVFVAYGAFLAAVGFVFYIIGCEIEAPRHNRRDTTRSRRALRLLVDMLFCAAGVMLIFRAAAPWHRAGGVTFTAGLLFYETCYWGWAAAILIAYGKDLLRVPNGRLASTVVKSHYH